MGDSYTIEKESISNVPLVKSGVRWGFSAVAATSMDFLMLTFATEILGIYYVISTAMGALSGGVVSFLLGRNWAFFNRENGVMSQAVRYIIANFSSIALNTSGVYLLTEVLSNNHYLVSKVIVASLIGLFYNFPMQRYFVFRKRN